MSKPIPTKDIIRIYSVGVWNGLNIIDDTPDSILEFTPLEFETMLQILII